MQDFRNDKSEERMGIFIDALYIKSARNSISAKRKTLFLVVMLYTVKPELQAAASNYFWDVLLRLQFEGGL